MSENFFKQKVISIRLTLLKNYFSDGSNTLYINKDLKEGDTGLPVELTYEQTWSYEQGGSRLAITVHNLSYDAMAQATCIHLASEEGFKVGADNEIEVMVGNLGEELTPLYLGYIQTAIADFNAAPTPAFKIISWGMAYESVLADDPITFKQGTSYDSIFKSLANKMGKTYVNKGVTGSISSPLTLRGSAYNKAMKVADSYGLQLECDDKRQMTVRSPDWRSDEDPVIINPQNGLIGYPVMTDGGVQFKCFYNPNLGVERPLQLETIVPQITGRKWRCGKITHKLSCFMKGAWESNVSASEWA